MPESNTIGTPTPGTVEEPAKTSPGTTRATFFGRIGSVTCSIGGAVFTTDVDAEAFVKRADQALYDAKRSGRNRVVG